MKKLFLVGWLQHDPLLNQILGQWPSADEMTPGEVPGRLVSGPDYWRPPVLVPEAEGRVKGRLLTVHSAEVLKRISYYLNAESPEISVTTEEGDKTASLCGALQVDGSALPVWSAEKWTDTFAPTEVLAACEGMSYFGRLTAAELARLRHGLLARAASSVRAETGTASAGQYTLADVELLERRYPYVGFYAFQEFDLTHRQFNGAPAPVITRGVLVGVEAAIVLPYDPARDRVLLVEQFRPGPFARGDVQPWLLEPVAGMVDAGEHPDQTAIREAEEEAGLDIRELVPLASAYPSPGNSSEFYYFYIGLCDISDEAGGVRGVASEAEDIMSHILSAEELFRRADAGALRNSPLLYCAAALRERREALRSA